VEGRYLPWCATCACRLLLKGFRPVRRVPEGLVDVVLSYCHHTLFDRTLEGLLPYLQGKGVGVINASVLSMGLLTHEARTRS
jgi:L-galactose dehydrogenase